MTADWRKLYPFASHFYTQPHGAKQHYVDEGQGKAAVVMVHGNPSWSFYYRNLVAGLKDRYRCIVPDHIGMGLSDKPDDQAYTYTLANRIDDLSRLMASAYPSGPFHLIVHDWGGAIGLGYALKNQARLKSLTLLNTAAFRKPDAKAMPWQLRLGRDSKFGAYIIRNFNAFARGAAVIGTQRKLAPEVRAGLLAPYDSPANRIATLRFVQDIPLQPEDPAYAPLLAIEQGLADLKQLPSLAVWGLDDVVFDHHFLTTFKNRLPQLQAHEFADAGHYILEDKPAEALKLISEHLDAVG
jgi:cis-3-alkyl-4-acyloxetan-2-one decarboxylase